MSLSTDRSPHPFIDLELGAGVVIRLRRIPPGRFLMGSPDDEVGRDDDEGPRHWVTLTRGFWLADAPCTRAEWRAVMGTEPSAFKGDDLPVEKVSWEDCQEFCKRLRLRFQELEPRLPTEAEWEYACRAGTTSAFNDGPALDKLGWFDGNSGEKTHPVRLKEANQWGLYDMHGNVCEWCEDCFGTYNINADDQVDPTGPTGRASVSVRVYRGGSWSNRPENCRSAFRGGMPPGGRSHDLGFRLVSGQVR
jgi:formylglycine-generating enzyme required for sulfatase activity